MPVVSARPSIAVRSIPARSFHAAPHVNTARLVVTPKPTQFHSHPFLWNNSIVPVIVMNNVMSHKRTQETSVNWRALGTDLAIVGLIICAVFISYFTARLLKTVVRKRGGMKYTNRKKKTTFRKYRDVV